MPKVNQELAFTLNGEPIEASMSIEFGPCDTGSCPAGVKILINGLDRTADLGGPFDQSKPYLNIGAYLKAGSNVIEFSTAQRGRLRVEMVATVPVPDSMLQRLDG